MNLQSLYPSHKCNLTVDKELWVKEMLWLIDFSLRMNVDPEITNCSLLLLNEVGSRVTEANLSTYLCGCLCLASDLMSGSHECIVYGMNKEKCILYHTVSKVAIEVTDYLDGRVAIPSAVTYSDRDFIRAIICTLVYVDYRWFDVSPYEVMLACKGACNNSTAVVNTVYLYRSSILKHCPLVADFMIECDKFVHDLSSFSPPVQVVREKRMTIDDSHYRTVTSLSSSLCAVTLVTDGNEQYVTKSGHIIELINEVAVLSVCNHPNIVKMVTFTIDKISKDLTIYMPVARESLCHAIWGNNFVRGWAKVDSETRHYWKDVYIRGTVTESRVHKERRVTYMRNLLEGLAYLHSLAIIHCDVKPDNILIDNCDNALICDFGISHVNFTVDKVAISAVYTAAYRPPELYNKSNLRYNFKSDVYALGTSLIEMCVGIPVMWWCRLPLKVESMVRDITKGELKCIRDRKMASVLLKMVDGCNTNRPSAAEALGMM